MDSWLVTIAQLPTEDPAARMRVLRTLESLGAGVMREGAYLLPDTAANRQALEKLSDYIVKSAGADQDRREPARRLRPFRSERDLARAAQAAPRVRGDRRARLLPHRRAHAGRAGAARGRRRGEEAALRVIADIAARGRAPAAARLGDAQPAVGRPARLRVADPPLRRPRGDAHLDGNERGPALGRARLRL